MNIIIMDTVTNAVDTILIFYSLGKIFNKKRLDYRKVASSLVFLILFGILMNQISRQSNLIRLVITLSLSTMWFSYALEEKTYKTLIYNIMIFIQMAIFEIVVISLISIILGIKPSLMLEWNIYKISAILLVKVGFFIYAKYGLKKVSRFLYISDNWKMIVLIAFFNIMVIFMTFILFDNIQMMSVFEYLYLAGMVIGSVVFTWATYSLVKEMTKHSYMEIVWKIKEEEFRKRDFYLKSMDDILQSIKSERHDLNNYLSVLYGLIYLENYDEAMEYIAKINDKVSHMHKIIETNHPVITSLISIKKNKALDHNILMELNVNLPEDLAFDYIDLSIVIGNLLDNAIEACQKILDGDRIIELNTFIENDSLIINTRNSKDSSCRVDVDQVFARYTSKEDKENHGRGLGNIKSIVNKYNGGIDVEDLGEEFRVDLRIPLETIHEISKDTSLLGI